MKPNLRPVPYPYRSQAYKERLQYLTFIELMPEAVAKRYIQRENIEARRWPVKGETCNAYARSTGKFCIAPALRNGRCRNHGGLSTGATSPEGRQKALSRLKQYR